MAGTQPSGHEYGGVSGEGSAGGDAYAYDPRFAIFEFTASIFLREVQVQLLSPDTFGDETKMRAAASGGTRATRRNEGRPRSPKYSDPHIRAENRAETAAGPSQEISAGPRRRRARGAALFSWFCRKRL